MATYIIKASGPGPSYAEIKRVDNDMVNNSTLLSESQQAVYEQAIALVKLSKKEDAVKALQDTFAWVRLEE